MKRQREMRGFASCFCVFLAVATTSIAFAQPAYNQASFLGGAGGVSTNDDYVLTSSWRQPVQTSVSAGGDYVNSSGFLSSEPDSAKNPFRISSVSYSGTPSPRIHLQISTLPLYSYSVQFRDSISGPQSWSMFGSTNAGVGTWRETNSGPSLFTFTDDFSTNTSGALPVSGQRYYRIQITPP